MYVRVCVCGGLLLAREREGKEGGGVEKGYLHIIKVGKGSVMRREYTVRVLGVCVYWEWC